MSALKYYDTTTGTWKYFAQGIKGDTGLTGPTGPAGPTGTITSATAPSNTSLLWVDTTTSTSTAIILNGTNVLLGGAISVVDNRVAVKNPDLLIVGNITRNAAGVVMSADVVFPDGTPGIYTTLAIDTSGAVNSYQITYGTSVTYTQPTITRDLNGAAIYVPQIVVS
jgi:hypothetical protein